MNKTLDPDLLRGLLALGPYLDDVVLAGGWVPHVYEVIYNADAADGSPRTRDIDLAIDRRVPVRGKGIDDVLKEAGFECRFHSRDTPPVTKYVAEPHGDEIEIEFITDAPGSREAAIHVQPGLTAQELHYVGLLMRDPWEVNLGELSGNVPGGILRVPTPGAFVFHKSLVFKDRTDRVKRDKDLYYIFFVLKAFPKWHATIGAELRRLAHENRAWFRKATRNMAALFADPDSLGFDALVAQRPRTAFADLSDDRFRQYAFDVMNNLIIMMTAATEGLEP